MNNLCSIRALILFALFLTISSAVNGQAFTRELRLRKGSTIEIVNPSGRVTVTAVPSAESGETLSVVTATGESVSDNEIKIEALSGKVTIEAVPTRSAKRIDISITVPERSRVSVETREGEVLVSGDLEQITVKTGTGTIAADVPTADLRYAMHWIASRPRVLADFAIENIKEKSGGRFEIKGKYANGKGENLDNAQPESEGNGGESGTAVADFKPKKEKRNSEKARRVELNFTTERGIILLNVPPNEVSSDLRERPLTNAAKAIIRSGDSDLMEAIRRAAPKYFGEYERTLPPVRREPTFAERSVAAAKEADTVKTAAVRVTDSSNRAIAGLNATDFNVTESGEECHIISVSPVTAPINLVLLLDVSGSVDNYVNFIRKAARNFVNTVGPRDRVSIVLFNDDVNVLSTFTTNKTKLSESLDTFEAGGGTAYYDAVAYTLAESLRPLKGERTAIVILTDGDDNRSFLSFDSLLGSIQESGALIYPLYVPSTLVAASGGDLNAPIDPLRQRYMTLTTKAEGEGERLAKLSGGVYYPITQLSQIQAAYEDIVVQLRTAYDVKFRSKTAHDPSNRPSPRLKIKVNKPNTFPVITGVTETP